MGEAVVASRSSPAGEWPPREPHQGQEWEPQPGWEWEPEREWEREPEWVVEEQRMPPRYWRLNRVSTTSAS